MQIQEVAIKRYSKALFELSLEQNKMDLFLEELKDVSNIVSEYKELKEILIHPNIPDKEKINIISEIFSKRVDEEILKLIFLLVENDRIQWISDVYMQYKYLVYEHKNIKIAYVTTAVKMEDAEIDALRSKLEKMYNSKIEFENIIDEEVIAGVYLKVDDNVYDGTVRGRLKSIKKNLLVNWDEVRI